MSADDVINKRSEAHRLRLEIKDARRENKRLLDALGAANRRAGIVDDMRASARQPAPIKAARKARGRREATAVLLCSDWHVGERVDRRKVGVNEYNPDIAASSARSLAEALVWMIEHHRTSWDIRNVVLWFGGDLITGYLHDDQRESNYMPPSSEILLVQDLLGHVIDEVLSLDGIARVDVPCSYGNHGRTTLKPRVSTGAENSYEWLLYHQMRRAYAKEERVNWHIADGELSYLQVYDQTIRFTHGDATKYVGGIGGMTIPVNKAIARWQTYRYADFTCIGHYHQYLDTPGLVANGSLIGTGPYGMRVGSHERPQQAFFLVDSERGKVQSTPLWVR